MTKTVSRGEALYYYQNLRWAWIHGTKLWHRYTANWKPDFGGELGIDYEKQIYKAFSAGLSFSYRYLRLEEMVTSYYENGEDSYYAEQSRNFGGFKVGLLMAFEF